ncbi:MAG: hypothetical protein JNL47_08130 [Bacteroidia bacterium]|nr:hypothetical protein [Bacteroidia bacterium]
MNIKHELDKPIRFYTNAGNGIFNNQRLIIDRTPGHIGIGLNHMPGNDILDVLPDANFPNTGIGINNETVLHNWGTQNIFVGVGAGRNNSTGFANAFFGMDAGYNNSVQGGNTYVGWNAGRNYDRGENTFVGSRSGEDNTGVSNVFVGGGSGFRNSGNLNTFIGMFTGTVNEGSQNLFIGNSSGQQFISGDFNVFSGYESGRNANGNENVFSGFQSGFSNDADYNSFYGSESGPSNTTGSQNSFFGRRAGFRNTKGINNVFIGADAGLSNTIGSENTFLGFNSGSGIISNLINAAAIGANATVLNDNKMILGDNQINVGIGLSNVSGGPHRKLHIQDADNAQLRLSHTYNINVANGVWTDFRNTDQGDLLINTQRMNGQNPEPHFVGINCSSAFPPLNTLEINSTALSPQLAGLRFRNLTNNVTPIANPDLQKGVLSVDANGDVIFVYDEGGNSGVFACQTPGPAINHVVKFSAVSGSTELCNTIAFDDGSHFGVNTNLTNPSQQLFYTFQNAGAGLFSNTPPAAILPTYNTNIGIKTPLAVQTHVDGNTRFGLIVYSNQPVLAPGNIPSSDHFKIYVENNSGTPLSQITDGQSIIETLGKPITFRRLGPWGLNSTTEDYLTIYPQEENVIIKRDFSTTALPLTFSVWNRPHFYVETTLPQEVEKYTSSIWGNHLGTADNPYYSQIGVQGTSTGVRNTLRGRNLGGNFFASGSDRNYGAYFNAQGGTFAYGMYATVQNPNCAPGINTCPVAAGYFSGPVYSTVNFMPSDSSLKNNISLLPDSFSVLDSIHIYSFEFDTIVAPQMNLPHGTHYGMISQEVAGFFPQLVKPFVEPEWLSDSGTVIYPEKEFLALNYSEFIALLIHGHQQQSHLLDSLFTRLDSLQQQINSCCNLRLPNNPDETGSIELKNIKSLQLLTADPNPFSESTIIRWSITNDFTNAVIFFYDERGQQINQYRITEKGNGELQVFGSRLYSGVYTYTLVVDGKIVKSKKMAKVN